MYQVLENSELSQFIKYFDVYIVKCGFRKLVGVPEHDIPIKYLTHDEITYMIIKKF